MGIGNGTSSRVHGDELSLTLFEEAGDAPFLFDPSTEQLIDVNPTAQRLCGFSRSDLLRMEITYLFRSELQGGMHRFRSAYRKTGLFHSQEGFLLRHQQSGVWIPVNLTVTRLHSEPRTLGMVTARDVREQREMIAQLRSTEAELRRVLSSISDVIWSVEIDGSGRVLHRYFSPVVERITGRPAEFYLADPDRWFSFVHPEDRSRVESAYGRARSGYSANEEHEYRLLRPDGSVRWVRDSVEVHRAADDDSLRLDGVLTDITDAQADSGDPTRERRTVPDTR